MKLKLRKEGRLTWMKGSYGELNKVRKTIVKHQNIQYFHRWTCGNDSRHRVLIPELKLSGDEFELILVCEDCNWNQDIPEFFTNEVVEDVFL